MKKKIVVLGGGTGMSTLLRGLKQFPVDITAIVSVCDDGKSTGRLRQEFNTILRLNLLLRSYLITVFTQQVI